MILQKWHQPENFETMEKLIVDAADPRPAIKV
jgi:hypothetical protein